MINDMRTNGLQFVQSSASEIDSVVANFDSKVPFSYGKNLFNKNTVVSNYFLSNTNVATSSSTYSYTDFIKVEFGINYVANNSLRFTTFFDENKNYVAGGSSAIINAGTVMTFPTNVKYIKVTLYNTHLHLLQIEKGVISTAFEVYLGSYVKDYLNTFSGKKWATLGDSITSMNYWQPKVESILGLAQTNGGIAGTKIINSGADTNSFSEGTRIEAMPIDADIISVMGGTNDWAQNTALGLQTSTNKAEFYGAVNSVIEQLLTKYPSKRIFFMTPPYGEWIDYASRGWTNAYTNTQGLTTRDYADAILNRCKAYNIPCLDIHSLYGANHINASSNYANDGAYIHPTNVTAIKISNLVIDFIKKL